MVAASEDELKLVEGHADGFEHGFDDHAIVLGAVVNELDGRLEVVEECMDVGEEDLYVAAGAEKVGELDQGYEVGGMGSASCCGPWCVGQLVSFATVFQAFPKYLAMNNA